MHVCLHVGVARRRPLVLVWSKTEASEEDGWQVAVIRAWNRVSAGTSDAITIFTIQVQHFTAAKNYEALLQDNCDICEW